MKYPGPVIVVKKYPSIRICSVRIDLSYPFPNHKFIKGLANKMITNEVGSKIRTVYFIERKYNLYNDSLSAFAFSSEAAGKIAEISIKGKSLTLDTKFAATA